MKSYQYTSNLIDTAYSQGMENFFFHIMNCFKDYAMYSI